MATAITALPGFELNPWTAFVPVLDVALLIKALFVGEAPVELVFLVLLASGMWAALALLVAARVFQAENVLLGGKESLRALLLPERPKDGQPTAGFVITFYAFALVVSFYGSLLVQRAGPLMQLLVTEYVFLLAPVVAVIALFRFVPRDALGLRAPTVRGVLGAVLIGASGWTLAATLIRLFPPPRALVEQLSDTLLLGGKPFPIVLLVVAVTPALCEELFFRGLVFAGLRRHGAWVTVLVSALLFALLHGSIYRLLPTFFLGAVMGWVRLVTRSVAPGVIVHALNNGIAVAILFYKPSWAESAAGGDSLPLGIVAAGAAVFALGLAALPRRAAE
jgi:sodium transport system permease protein